MLFIRAYNSPMRAIRRPENAARLEMMPMIDVIFLLLTFFIYNLLISTPVRVMPTKFVDAATGNRAGIERPQVLRVDKDGRFFLGENPVEPAELDGKLRTIANNPANPTLFIQLDAKAEFDRGPLLVNVLEYVMKSGIKNVSFVGTPGDDRLIGPKP